jgi:hypothetical protein
MDDQNYYVLFPNVTEGLKLEKHLKEKGIKYTIVPTPRELSKCCGICIMYEKEAEDSIRLEVEKHEIKTEGFRNLPKRKPAVRFI